MANNTIKDFRNGRGYIYITQADGTTFVSVLPNTGENGSKAQRMVYMSAPLSGDIVATGFVNLTGGSGTITAITVNGVDILGSTTASGAPSVVAPDAVNLINTYSSSPDYKAILIGDSIMIQALPGTGSSPNNYVVAVAATGTLAYNVENMRGGVNSQGLIDDVYGYRAFLNADYDADGCSGQGTASPYSLTNALEITKYLVNRGFQTSYIEKDVEISGVEVEIEREASATIANVLTAGSIAASDLQVISTADFQENDLIIIRGQQTAKEVTLKSYVGGSDNIYLANDADFTTGDLTKAIALRYINGVWNEEYRTPGIVLTVAGLRAANIACPVQGVTVTSLPTSGTINLTPGTSKEYQEYTGSPALIGSIVIQGAGTPLDGDHFWVKWLATPTVGGNTVTIFGITLTATQAASGKVTVYSEYDLTNTTWRSTIIQEANGVDFATDSPFVSGSASGSVQNATGTGIASGIGSVNLSITNSTASGGVSFVGGSGPMVASGFASFIFTDNDGTYGPIPSSDATGVESSILGGRNSTVTGNYSAAFSAENTTVSGANSVALGTKTRTVNQANVTAVETLQMFGGIQQKEASSTGGTLTIADYARYIDSSGGNITEVLPAAPKSGQEYLFVRAVSASNTIVVDGNGKSINGSATYTLGASLYDRAKIMYCLSLDAWFVISE